MSTPSGERDMSHIVVYQSPDGSSGFEPCTSLEAAVVAAERMKNVDGVDTPRIFKMEEVQLDFRPYFRVEVSGAVEADFSSLSAGAMSSLASAPSTSSEQSKPNDFETIDFSAPGENGNASSENIVSDKPGAPADLSSTLEHSVSAMGSLGSVESLNKLEESVEAFAKDAESTDLPPPPEAVADTDEPVADKIDEPEPANDPLVSVRRGLFGR